MRFRAKCPHCQGLLSLRDEDVGKEVPCPHCRVRFKAAAPKTAPPSPTPLPGRERGPAAEAEEPIVLEEAKPGATAPADAAIQLFDEIEKEGQAAPQASARPAGEKGLGMAPPTEPTGWSTASAIAAETSGNLAWSPLAERIAAATSHRPPVPTVVRVYGIVIMVLIGLLTVVIAVQVLVALPDVLEFLGARGFYYLVVFSAVWLGIGYFLYRIGRDMRDGRRWAIVALSVMCGLAALQATLMWVGIGSFQPLTTDGMTPAWAAQMKEVHEAVARIRVIFVAVACVLTLIVATSYIPPLVSAYRHWEAFE
jgi:hypothetical protein